MNSLKLAAGAFAAAICGFAGDASALVITDRGAFEAAVDVSVTEDFESYSGTVAVTGPLATPSGFVLTSPSNSLFHAGPGQSSNPTQAFGSNIPASDHLAILLGANYTAFGVDLFQNNAAGSQFGSSITYAMSFYDEGVLVASENASVAPNGGSFFGFLSSSAFDEVRIFSLSDSYEVVDNISAGSPSGASPVPLPGGLPLILGALAAFGAVRARRCGRG